LDVPNVVGLRPARAARVLATRKLRVRLTERYAGAPRGTIFAQSPPAGELAPHGQMTVLVSKGGARVSSLIGLPEAQAGAELRRRGFLLRVVAEPPISAANRLVVSQIPGPGWTRAHRMITLHVSSGPQAVLLRVDRLWSSFALQFGLQASPSSCRPFAQPGVYTCTGTTSRLHSSTEVSLTAGRLSLWRPPKTHKHGGHHGKGHGHRVHGKGHGHGKGHRHGGHHQKPSGSSQPSKP
jgi:hypothetical protein